MIQLPPMFNKDSLKFIVTVIDKANAPAAKDLVDATFEAKAWSVHSDAASFTGTVTVMPPTTDGKIHVSFPADTFADATGRHEVHVRATIDGSTKTIFRAVVNLEKAF